MDAQALRDLPPLPKSLSGLINFNSSQWRELERVHLMRTMIQQDLSRTAPVAPARSSSASRASASRQRSPHAESLLVSLGNNRAAPGGMAKDAPNTWSGRSSRLDAQLAILRKEMVGLRQMDMSLLCQLWSLNESIQEYKQALQDRSPSWDPSQEELLSQLNGASPNMATATFDLAPMPPPTARHQRSSSEGSTPRRYDPRHPPRNLMAVPERTLTIDSSSGSSGEYDDVL
ncbi:uncharacterized protein LOC144133579 [Amblyomma americanum]